MPKSMNKTLSLTIKHINILEELCDKANSDEFQKIINGDYK